MAQNKILSFYESCKFFCDHLHFHIYLHIWRLPDSDGLFGLSEYWHKGNLIHFQAHLEAFWQHRRNRQNQAVQYGQNNLVKL